MSEPIPHSPSSQQLERLREVLVGRPMRTLEQRLERLELQLRDFEPSRIREHHEALHDLYAIAEAAERQQQELREFAQQLWQTVQQQQEELAGTRRFLENELMPYLELLQREVRGDAPDSPVPPA